jgi:hypothetical protein
MKISPLKRIESGGEFKISQPLKFLIIHSKLLIKLPTFAAPISSFEISAETGNEEFGRLSSPRDERSL